MTDLRGVTRPRPTHARRDERGRDEPLERTVAGRLAERIGAREFDMWFGHSTELKVSANHLEVCTGSPVAAEWITRHFGEALEGIAREVMGETSDVEVRYAPDLAPAGGTTRPAPRERAPEPSPNGSTRSSNTAFAPPQTRPNRSSGSALPLRYRLEEFVVGSSNALGFGAAERIAEDRDPHGLTALFLFGECGVGKTHLLQGVCRRHLERFPGAIVRYTTGEQFTNEFIASVRGNTIDQFRQRLRQVDLLAIDDVHFLANKQQTQSEFLHTLDTIDLSGARVVLASDEHPSQIQSFSQRLVSRFMKGMVVEMARPDRETRQQIVRRMAALRGLRLNDAAVELIVTNCVGSVREIEGALTKLAALRMLSPAVGGDDAEVGVVLVERLFQDRQPARTPLRVATILDTVCRKLGVEKSELLASSRHRRIVLARGLVSYLARELTTLSYPEIARAIGRRNHSTVLTAGRRLQEQLERSESVELDPQAGSIALRELVDQLRHDLIRGGR